MPTGINHSFGLDYKGKLHTATGAVEMLYGKMNHASLFANQIQVWVLRRLGPLLPVEGNPSIQRHFGQFYTSNFVKSP